MKDDYVPAWVDYVVALGIGVAVFLLLSGCSLFTFSPPAGDSVAVCPTPTGGISTGSSVDWLEIGYALSLLASNFLSYKVGKRRGRR